MSLETERVPAVVKYSRTEPMISVMNLNGKSIMSTNEPSNYMSNMMLPEMVRATRTHPLGPDCIISRNEITDQKSLRSVNYYWYISHEKGCVECVVKMSRGGTNVTTSDPKCVVTRKHRRFEAYCCMICRSNFVTVVQALLHLKAIHRSTSKILIQDLDIFHNIEKAMEVPPVPLPWHIAKKYVDQDKTLDFSDFKKGDYEQNVNNYVIPPGATLTSAANDMTLEQLAESPNPQSRESPTPPESNNVNSTSKGDSPNTVISIISAIAKEFEKPISALSFSDDSAQVTIKFADGNLVIAQTPDLVGVDKDEKILSNIDTDSILTFTSVRTKGEDNTEILTLLANDRPLARKLFSETIVKGVRDKDKSTLETETEKSQLIKRPHSSSTESIPTETKSPPIKTNKPIKSVRFMLGAPDSSDDERPSTPDKNGRLHRILESKLVRHETVSTTTLKPTSYDTASALSPSREETTEATTDTFDGLRNVVDDLITTASKGRIIPLPPASPLATSADTTLSLPLVGSSPQLSNLMSLATKEKTTSTLTRVQSWSPSLGGASFSVASMRRPYTARGFTYAEKIELMKQQNDYDAEFISQLNRKTATSSTTTTTKSQFSNAGMKSTNVSTSGRKDRKGRRKFKGFNNNQQINKDKDESSSSDAETKQPKPNSNKNWDEELSSQSNDSDHNSTYSDEHPPTLLNPAAAAAAYTGLLRTAIMSGAGFPSVPVSDYYGSGEWATAAMETLKSLQSTMDTKNFEEKVESMPKVAEDFPPNISENIKKEFLEIDFDSLNPPMDTMSDDPSYLSDSTNHTSRKRSKSNEPQTSHHNEEDNIPVSPKRHKPDSDSTLDVLGKNKTLEKIRSPQKRLSPLLSDSEKRMIVHRSKSSVSSQPPKIRESGSLLAAHLRAKTSMMGSKSCSDPALSSRLLESNPLPNKKESKKSSSKSSNQQAAAGDTLVFLNDITMKDFNNNESTLTWFCPKTKMNENKLTKDSAKTQMNMPEVFKNCVDTYMKVRLVQKMHVCKVCGFSVVATDSGEDGEKMLQTHVMEHSLKEIYQTGSEIENWK
ncbi:zinc finger protein ZF(C2H2)-68 isoform X3 [Ciona intestinalis]